MRNAIQKIIKKEGLVRKYRVRKLKYKYIKAPLKQGELVEIDVKYVPNLVGNEQYYQFTAIDCATRWRYLKIYDNYSNIDSIDFFETLMTSELNKVNLYGDVYFFKSADIHAGESVSPCCGFCPA